MKSIVLLPVGGAEGSLGAPHGEARPVGAFALTEPMHGSDFVALEPSAGRPPAGCSTAPSAGFGNARSPTS